MGRVSFLRVFRLQLACAALLGMSVCANADLTPSIEQTTSIRLLGAPSDAGLLQTASLDVGSGDALRPEWLDDGLAGFSEVSGPRHFAAEPPTNVITLPESPGSMGLFLSGALSIGAWHLVRSARNLHFANLPEWYHSGCPDQIGHAVPFDLDLTLQPLCEVLQPVCDERPLFFRHCLEELRPRDVHFFSIVTSRGPPCSV